MLLQVEPCPTCGEDTLRVPDENGDPISCALCIGERMFEFRYSKEEIRSYADRN